MEEFIFQTFLKGSVNLLTFFNLGSWHKEFDLGQIDPRAKAMIEAGRDLKISFRRFFLNKRPSEIFLAKKDNNNLIFKHLPIRSSNRDISKSKIDNKWQAKKILIKNGLPASIGFPARTKRDICLLAEKIGFPVVIKPINGSLSENVYPKIKNLDQLSRILNNFKRSASLLVEKHHIGRDYRVSLVKGRFVAACLREPANIIGNGRETIKSLIGQKNRERRAERSSTLKPIKIDKKLISYLRTQNLSLDSVPLGRKKIYLSDRVNLASGADIIDMTEQVHPGNREIFEKVGQVFRADILGIDFLSQDISRQGGRIIELNSLPYINMHHEPYRGRSIPVGRYLWQEIFQ